MAYRKLSADNLFTGYEMLDSNAVLVIDEEGVVQDVVAAADAGENIERFAGLITPGLVNCHCHLELSHMRGMIPEGTGIIDFLLSVMSKRNYSDEIIHNAITIAETEMTGNGIVAVGDICNTGDTILKKKESQIYYHNFIEATGFVDATAETRFKTAVHTYRKFADVGPASIVPHAPYSVSPTLFSFIDDFEPGSLISMHNQESAAENEFFANASGDFLRLYSSIGIDIKHFTGTGRTSLVSALDRLSTDHKIILVHNVLTDVNDLEHVKERMNNLYWCFCPNANLYINGELPNVNLIREYSENIVLGTDSLASNYELNILSEIETLRNFFPGIDHAELLKWATINGARALGIDNIYGSFEKRKRPGVISIQDDGINRLA